MTAKEKICGFINVYKPSGITSHDVVNRVRRLIKVKQVGHGGTLDPLAAGVLPVAVGPACRLLRFLPQNKTYVAEILLGQQTTTDDIEGDTINSAPTDGVTKADIEAALEKFRGTIDQVPPLFSAIHVDGKRLYELARAGNTAVEIKPRQVTIFRLEILSIDIPVIKVRVACSSGTYIRSIARDVGAMLNTFGCLKSLLREQAGLFSIDRALTLEALAEQNDDVTKIITDPVEILSRTGDFDTLHVDEAVARKIALGQFVDASTFADLRSDDRGREKLVLIVHEQKLVAVCHINAENKLKPEVVIADGQHKN